MDVNEQMVSQATGLPLIGEKWFKGKTLNSVDLNFFLLTEFKDPEWKDGIPYSYLHLKWHKVLRVLQRYLTCEGIFQKVTLYLMRLLAHISGQKKMNLAYFLYQSLFKMSKKVQLNLDCPPHFVYHSGLIKILVKQHLLQKKLSWEDFLAQEGFAQMSQRKKMGRPPKPNRNETQIKVFLETKKQSEDHIFEDVVMTEMPIVVSRVTRSQASTFLKSPIPFSFGFKELK